VDTNLISRRGHRVRRAALSLAEDTGFAEQLYLSQRTQGSQSSFISRRGHRVRRAALSLAEDAGFAEQLYLSQRTQGSQSSFISRRGRRVRRVFLLLFFLHQKYTKMQINQITSLVIEECIKIHKDLGPGLLESVYEEILCYRLGKRGVPYKRQEDIPVYYENNKMGVGFRADVIVEDKVIVELKSVDHIPQVFYKKLNTYLKISKLSVGLMINFNVVLLKDGITRIVNKYDDENE
jgi:GxxExxY protein